MTNRILILVILSIAALATQVAASEFTVSLTDKVRESDLVAVITITGVERRHIHGPEIRGPIKDQEFKFRASVAERIKGSSSDTIEIDAVSTFSTAGFSAYGIGQGRSYIAYLRKAGEATYRLSLNSNQSLEGISDDGRTVNDIGQTTDQVLLVPKLWRLRALALGERIPALITVPAFLGVALLLVLGIFAIRMKRSRSRRQTQ